MHDDENNGQGFQDHDNYCKYANHAAKEPAAHPKVVSGLPISYKERATIANGRPRKSVYNVPHISQFLCFDSSYFISQIRHFCVCVCVSCFPFMSACYLTFLRLHWNGFASLLNYKLNYNNQRRIKFK